MAIILQICHSAINDLLNETCSLIHVEVSRFLHYINQSVWICLSISNDIWVIWVKCFALGHIIVKCSTNTAILISGAILSNMQPTPLESHVKNGHTFSWQKQKKWSSLKNIFAIAVLKLEDLRCQVRNTN